MESSVQLFAAIHFFVIGLSHVLSPRAWADFFDLLRRQGEPGVFAVGFLSLLFGSIIAAFHNVWSGLPVVLTILGWAQVLKGLLYLAFPAFGLRRMRTVPPERAHLFVYGGFFSLALSGFCIYLFVTSG